MSDNILSKGTIDQINSHSSEAGEIIFKTEPVGQETVVVFNSGDVQIPLARADMANASFTGRNITMILEEITSSGSPPDFSFEPMNDPKYGMELQLTGTNLPLVKQSGDPLDGDLVMRVPGLWMDFSVPYSELVRLMPIQGSGSASVAGDHLEVVNFANRKVIFGKKLTANTLLVKGIDTTTLEGSDITRDLKFYRRKISITA